MHKDGKRQINADLYKAVLLLKTPKECADFFEDLCTITELCAMEQRFEVAMLLEQGYIYSDILERTGASSATISRVNRSLRYGAGGYTAALTRLGVKKKSVLDNN
ncbi:MAG: YerC/YecD family TrpR-related protein [Oscillospiraceae bacterium]|nr:YerC/YecD family TrpR-related protein [Oscillospiraceae bacterium]